MDGNLPSDKVQLKISHIIGAMCNATVLYIKTGILLILHGLSSKDFINFTISSVVAGTGEVQASSEVGQCHWYIKSTCNGGKIFTKIIAYIHRISDQITIFI